MTSMINAESGLSRARLRNHEKKGEKLVFEVATPSAPHPVIRLQAKLNEAGNWSR
jgi:hypothetical protein